MGKQHQFWIHCDRRQLPYFQRFFEDQTIHKGTTTLEAILLLQWATRSQCLNLARYLLSTISNQHSSALFTLRSARIVWREKEGKGEPWNRHHLSLHCTIDTQLWTAAGTKQIVQKKACKIREELEKFHQKEQTETLNANKYASIRRKNSTLARLENPFPRPQRSLYQGQSNLIVGVAFSLEKPATVAIVNATTGKAIAYRSIKQLLGKHYPLLNRQHRQKRQQSHKRDKSQKSSVSVEFGTSNLGEYIDRLLAKAIITLATQYNAASIVIPKLGDMRELIQSEIQAKAEAKIPGYIEGP